MNTATTPQERLIGGFRAAQAVEVSFRSTSEDLACLIEGVAPGAPAVAVGPAAEELTPEELESLGFRGAAGDVLALPGGRILAGLGATDGPDAWRDAVGPAVRRATPHRHVAVRLPDAASWN